MPTKRRTNFTPLPKPKEPVKPSPETVETIDSQAFSFVGRALDIHTKSRQELERERKVLAAALLEEERELGRESFWYFLTNILFPGTWEANYVEAFHRPLVEAAQNLQRGEDLWMFMQREARKTFIFDIAHNIWRIIRDPNIRLLLVGAREETVKPFARVIRSAFEYGTPGFEKFQETYAEFITEGRGKHLKQAFQFTVANRTVNLPDPTFRAAYLGVTGAGWRCDILTFDDPVERRNVTTPEVSAKALGQMLDLLPLVSKTSDYQNIIGMGTRWAYHDPYGKLIGDAEETETDQVVADKLSQYQTSKTRIIIRHAIEDPNRQCEHCPPHIVAAEPHGHPVSPFDDAGVATLFPIHTKEGLIDTLEKYLKDPSKGESLWWHQYQNVCLAPSAQKFKTEWFQLVLEKPAWPAPKKRILAIDSADKDFQKKGIGDWMVAVMGDFDDIGRLCCRYGLRSNKWTREEFIARIIAWCRGVGWWPQIIAKEKFGNDTFLTDIARSFNNIYHPTSVVAVQRPAYTGTVMKKFDWIVETLQGPMERGEVIFGSQFPVDLRQRAEYEGTALGQTTHDDVIDTMTLFFTPGVRVLAPNRALGPGSSWTPPPLNLYEPGAQAPPTPPGLGKSPLQTPRVEIMINDLGFNQISFDQPNGPNPLNLTFDPWSGTN